MILTDICEALIWSPVSKPGSLMRRGNPSRLTKICFHTFLIMSWFALFDLHGRPTRVGALASRVLNSSVCFCCLHDRTENLKSEPKNLGDHELILYRSKQRLHTNWNLLQNNNESTQNLNFVLLWHYRRNTGTHLPNFKKTNILVSGDCFCEFETSLFTHSYSTSATRTTSLRVLCQDFCWIRIKWWTIFYIYDLPSWISIYNLLNFSIIFIQLYR